VCDTAEGFTRSFKEVVALEDVILSHPKLFCSGEEAGNIGRLGKAVFAGVDARDCTWFELVEEPSQGWGRGKGSSRSAIGRQRRKSVFWGARGGRAGLHAQNITVTDGLAKEPAFSVLTTSHSGRSSNGGRRRATTAHTPDAFEASQTPDALVNVVPVTGFDALGRSCELSDEEG